MSEGIQITVSEASNKKETLKITLLEIINLKISFSYKPSAICGFSLVEFYFPI